MDRLRWRQSWTWPFLCTLKEIGFDLSDEGAAEFGIPRQVHFCEVGRWLRATRAHSSGYREEYPPEGAALDEVTKCLCSSFKRKSLSDDRLDLARFKKLCNRRPCSCPSRYGLREQRKAFDAGTLPDQVGHIDGRFPARCVAERGETATRRQDPECIAQDVATNTVHDDVCPITISKATHAFHQPFRREVDDLGEAQFFRLRGLYVTG